MHSVQVSGPSDASIGETRDAALQQQLRDVVGIGAEPRCLAAFFSGDRSCWRASNSARVREGLAMFLDRSGKPRGSASAI